MSSWGPLMDMPACGRVRSSQEPECHPARRSRSLPRARALLLLGTLALGGCASLAAAPTTNTTPFTTGHELQFTEVNADRFRPWSNIPPRYRVGPGDKLKVKYFITRDMDEELTVSPDGTIAPRAIGQLSVDGETLGVIEERIRKASLKELVDQKVVVALDIAAAPKIYVGGMVQQPGVFKLDNESTSVLQGILMAGGFSDTARTGQVALIRRGPNNEPMLRLIDARQIIENGFSDSDVPLQSGDVLFVPGSTIAEINLWIDQFINRVVPFQRQFAYTIGNYTQQGGGTTFLP